MVEFLVDAAVLYALAGLAFAIAFAWRGVGSVDAVARQSTLGFRALVLPGAALLWPMLAVRWWRSSGAPGVGALGGPEVPGDRTDRWSGPSETLRLRAFALWLALAPLLAAVILIALAAREPLAPAAADAGRLPPASAPGVAR